MKSARLENGVLQIQDRPTPNLGPEDALIRMSSAGVCHSDLHIVRGDWAGIPGNMPLGHEGIGIVEELGRDHVRTARAFGASAPEVLVRHVLPNAATPIVTRLLFSIPLVVVSGSLLIESYFGIPGIGRATYEAMGAGDLPVLKAIVGITPVLFVAALMLADLLCHAMDPRVELQ